MNNGENENLNENPPENNSEEDSNFLPKDPPNPNLNYGENDLASSSNEVAEEKEKVPPKPWGFWANVGWCVLIVVATLVSAVIAVLGYILITGQQLRPEDVKALESNGTILSIAGIFQAIPWILIPLLLVHVRGCSKKEYFGWKFYNCGFWKYFLVFVGFMIGMDLFTWAVRGDVIYESMVELYRTSDSLILLCFAIIIVAPVSEEILFRGFLYHGWAHSKIGPVGAIILTSAIWAVIHSQYDWFGVGLIFASGLFLGYVRWKSGSVILPMVYHGIMNLVATIQIMLHISRNG